MYKFCCNDIFIFPNKINSVNRLSEKFANIKVYVIGGVPVIYKIMTVREKVHCRFNFSSTQAKITYASLNMIIGN